MRLINANSVRALQVAVGKGRKTGYSAPEACQLTAPFLLQENVIIISYCRPMRGAWAAEKLRGMLIWSVHSFPLLATTWHRNTESLFSH